jgi:hypothetical protein
MRRLTVGVVTMLTVASGLPLAAHHTVAYSYDVSRAVTLAGVVTEVVWTNPHAIYHLLVPDDAGRSIDWEIESRHLRGMRADGVDVDAIQVGDRVSMRVFLALDGRHRAATASITLSDGRTVRVCTVTNGACP